MSNLKYFLLVHHAIITVIAASTLTYDKDLRASNIRLINELQKHETESTISFKIDSSLDLLDSLGSTIDSFLESRPWWIVKNEPYTCLHDNINTSTTYTYDIELYRFSEEWQKIFDQISYSQYPMVCNKMLVTRNTIGFDSLGNNFYNYKGGVAFNIWGVYVPLIVDPNTIETTFLDRDFCPDIPNKYYCAFLRVTNCSLPSDLEKCVKTVNCDPHDPKYSNATSEGVLLQSEEARKIAERDRNNAPFQYHDHGMTGPVFWRDMQHKTHSENIGRDGRNHMFTYGFMYRLNYKFRSLVTKEILDFKSKLAKPFPMDGDCVAIHVRRRDRVIPGLKGEDMRRWCKTHKRVDNKCFNEETNTYYPDNEDACNKYWDMGCHTGHPYGSLVVADFLNASRLLPYTKNVFIATDDGEAVEKELQLLHDERNVMLFPAPQGHRNKDNNIVKSTAHGVNYFAVIELSRQCSYFVGHSGSAVTNFIMDIMCARHGVNKFGVCPPFYDFARH